MDYPNQRLLVNVDWLRAHLDDEMVVVLDVRAGQAPLAYREQHIRRARPFSLPHAQAIVEGTPDCLDSAAMAEQLGALGVRPEQTVVLYDECYSTTLTRTFWAFERIGQQEVRVLEGGLAAWQAAGGATSQGLPAFAPCTYETLPRDHCLATAPWIERHAPEAQLVDARGPQEWRAGHIAGAVNCCWHTLAQDEEGRALLPAGAAQARGMPSSRKPAAWSGLGR